MSSDKADKNGSPEGEGVHPQGTKTRHFRGYWNFENTKDWVKMFREKRMSAIAIGAAVGADPSTVSTWLKKHGAHIYPGLHRIDRESPNIPPELIQLLIRGPDEVMSVVNERAWRVLATPDGREQLKKFCEFVKLPKEVGVIEAATKLSIHRDVLREWTLGTDMPYLVTIAEQVISTKPLQGRKLLPLRVEAGGNKPSQWINAPTTIQRYGDVLDLLGQLQPLEVTYARAQQFGVSRENVDAMRPELFAYALGMALGDSGKEGGQLQRFASANLDLVLSKKHPSNETLGEFTSTCVNSLGIEMSRIKDKAPTGDTLEAEHPWDSYRWTSERSPLIAWMMFVGLGIAEGQTTSNDAVQMEWIINTPYNFRKRFVQALADSDGTARDSVVEIASLPNAVFVTRVLHSLDMRTAYTRNEYGNPVRSVVQCKEAARLPIFNEFVKSYRYQKLMEHI